MQESKTSKCVPAGALVLLETPGAFEDNGDEQRLAAGTLAALGTNGTVDIFVSARWPYDASQLPARIYLV